jgi:hypothetical protein
MYNEVLAARPMNGGTAVLMMFPAPSFLLVSSFVLMFYCAEDVLHLSSRSMNFICTSGP